MFAGFLPCRQEAARWIPRFVSTWLRSCRRGCTRRPASVYFLSVSVAVQVGGEMLLKRPQSIWGGIDLAAIAKGCCGQDGRYPCAREPSTNTIDPSACCSGRNHVRRSQAAGQQTPRRLMVEDPGPGKPLNNLLLRRCLACSHRFSADRRCTAPDGRPQAVASSPRPESERHSWTSTDFDQYCSDASHRSVRVGHDMTP